MLATPGVLPIGAQWCYEVKWDGMRLGVDVHGGALKLTSRTGRDMTPNFPELAGLAGLVDDVALDGEVVLMVDGKPSFAALSERFHRAPTAAEVTARPVALMLFDVLRLYGVSLLDRPLAERRETLTRLDLADVPNVQLSPTWDNGEVLFDVTRDQGLEGVIAKRRDSLYRPGVRSTDWVKVPHRHAQDCIVGGWRPERERVTQIGSLLLGVPDGDGGWRFAGRVGSGVGGNAVQRTLRALLPDLTVDEPPFTEPPPREDAADAHWCRPALVAMVTHSGWTDGGRLRHPVFKGLRADVDPSEVTPVPGRPSAPPTA
jgi:bifunctional non-homologous end joining protein LigD